MNCGRVNRLLSAYMDGELSGEEMMAVRSHIRSCPACENELEGLRALKGVIGQLQRVQPDAGLEARLLAALPPAPVPLGEQISAWVRTHLTGRMQPAAAAVACCAALLAITVGHFPQGGHWDDQVARTLEQSPAAVARTFNASGNAVIPVSPVELEQEYEPERRVMERLLEPQPPATLTTVSTPVGFVQPYN